MAITAAHSGEKQQTHEGAGMTKQAVGELVLADGYKECQGLGLVAFTAAYSNQRNIRRDGFKCGVKDIQQTRQKSDG